MATIFCDTDCELWYTQAEKYGLEVIRMPYIVDGEEILADLGENNDTKDLYDKMRAGAKVSTAAQNEPYYYEKLKPFFEKGDDILYIAFSSKMSGTFAALDSAVSKLDKEYPGVKFRRFDTYNICMGTGILVYLGAKYCREHGDDIDATYSYLESIVDKASLNFIVEDMKYLARGGRISPAKAKIANLMNIKPILIAKDGVIDVGAKKNGLKKAVEYIVEQFAANYNAEMGAPVTIVDADNPQMAENLKNEIVKIAPDAEIWTQPIGPVIGCHAGPGAFGVIYMTK